MSEFVEIRTEPLPEAPVPAPMPAPPPLGFAGDPIAHFVINSSRNAQFAFSALAGRYVALCFAGPFGDLARDALSQALASGLFRDESLAAVIAVSTDPGNEAAVRTLMGIHCAFWDYDLAASRQFGAAPADAVAGRPHIYSCFWLLLDPMLRTVQRVPLSQTAWFLDLVRRLPPPALHAGCAVTAPVLTVPRIFEPAFCEALIGLYERGDSAESGFMVESDGKTVGRHDFSYKRRRDYWIEDARWRDAIGLRLSRRLLPEIRRSFQFSATRIERYLVACYDSGTGGFFRPHRDDTSQGTRHRKFAVTINLNAEGFEGGDLCFPEFGDRTYRAPTGGAIVFSCSLLHEARPVTSGRRYACLPFLYDDASARIRQESEHLIVNAPPV